MLLIELYFDLLFHVRLKKKDSFYTNAVAFLVANNYIIFRYNHIFFSIEKYKKQF